MVNARDAGNGIVIAKSQMDYDTDSILEVCEVRVRGIVFKAKYYLGVSGYERNGTV